MTTPVNELARSVLERPKLPFADALRFFGGAGRLNLQDQVAQSIRSRDATSRNDRNDLDRQSQLRPAEFDS